MSYIANEKIEEILSSIDIVEFIGEYLDLKQVGSNFRTLCPFHSEKTPSFYVSREKNIYHCFGCGKSGNAIKFLMEFENVSFKEALTILAEKSGINLEINYKGTQKDTSYFKILDDAKKYYIESLFSHNGKLAYQYLQHRNINADTIKSFSIGYSSSRGLTLFMENHGWNKQDLMNAGLLVKNSNGEYYERFHNRIMFPIFNTIGKVVGFGGRALGNELPKYINSPETEYYKKGKLAYGLYHSKNSISKLKNAIIVEGYIDLLTMYQNGITNVAAPLGTSLTSDQIKLIKRYSHSITLLFDADHAGIRAMERGVNISLKQDMSVYVVLLDNNLDPDEYIKENGIESLKNKINEKTNFIDFKISVLKDRYDINDIDQLNILIKELLTTVNDISDPIKRELWYRKISDLFSVNIELLRSAINKKEVVIAKDNANENSLDNIYLNILSVLYTAHKKHNFYEYIEMYIPIEYFKDNKIGNIIYDIAKNRSIPEINDITTIVTGSYRERMYKIIFSEKVSDEMLMNSLKINAKKLLKIKLKEINDKITKAISSNEEINYYESKQSKILHHLQKIK
jgi:DNA primase